MSSWRDMKGVREKGSKVIFAWGSKVRTRLTGEANEQ